METSLIGRNSTDLHEGQGETQTVTILRISPSNGLEELDSQLESTTCQRNRAFGFRGSNLTTVVQANPMYLSSVLFVVHHHFLA